MARVWLGDTFVAEHANSRDAPPRRYATDRADELSDGRRQADDLQDIIVSKDGDGRLYYRLGMSYAPTDLNLTRWTWASRYNVVYEPSTIPADVTRDEDGIWHIKAGARVRVQDQHGRQHPALSCGLG